MTDPRIRAALDNIRESIRQQTATEAALWIAYNQALDRLNAESQTRHVRVQVLFWNRLGYVIITRHVAVWTGRTGAEVWCN